MRVGDGAFEEKVKELEMKGIHLSSHDQIYRLTKPTSKYLNLNPYEVLQLPFGASDELIRKHFHKLSLVVHPDKNANDRDSAKSAFEVIKLANEILKTPEEFGKIRLIYDEAMAQLNKKLAQNRKRNGSIPEDQDAEKYFELKRGTIAKLFADYELKRQEYVENDTIERKRTRNDEIFNEFTEELENEYRKAWDEGRSQRVHSWRNFNKESKSGKKKNRSLKPPVCRPEVRNAGKSTSKK